MSSTQKLNYIDGSKADIPLKPVELKGGDYSRKPSIPVNTTKETPEVITRYDGLTGQEVNYRLVQLKNLSEYREKISNSPTGSNCIQALKRDATQNIHYESLNDTELTKDEKEETEKLIARCNVSDFGNFWQDAIHISKEFAGNVPIEVVFSALDSSLLGFRVYNPLEVWKAVNTDNGMVDGYVRRFYPYDSAEEKTQWFEKYPLHDFQTFDSGEDFQVEIELDETGGSRVKRYMFYIKGFSDVLNMFGSFPDGILNLLAFDYEQLNTLTKYTANGGRGSWLFALTVSDGVEERKLFVGQGEYDAETGQWSHDSIWDQFEAAIEESVGKSYSITGITFPEGSKVDPIKLTDPVDLSGFNDMSTDTSQQIQSWFGVPDVALSKSHGSGMNSEQADAQLKQYHLVNLPSTAAVIFDPVNIVYQRHITPNAKLTPTFSDPTSELDKAKTNEIYIDKNVLDNNEVREEVKPGAEPLEETEQVTEQEEIEENE